MNVRIVHLRYCSKYANLGCQLFNLVNKYSDVVQPVGKAIPPPHAHAKRCEFIKIFMIFFDNGVFGLARFGLTRVYCINRNINGM